MHKRSLENDCVALLAYIWAHRDDEQTYTGLAEATSVPYETIRQMVEWHKRDPNNWALRNYGTKYGYVVRYLGKRKYPHRWHLKTARVPGGQVVSVYVTFTKGAPKRAGVLTRRVARFGTKAEAMAFIGGKDHLIALLEGKILDVVYVGMMQDGEGRLFLEDVPEFHPAQGSDEIPSAH